MHDLWLFFMENAMKPYYEDSAVTIYNCDCREILPALPKDLAIISDPNYTYQVIRDGMALGAAGAQGGAGGIDSLGAGTNIYDQSDEELIEQRRALGGAVQPGAGSIETPAPPPPVAPPIVGPAPGPGSPSGGSIFDPTLTQQSRPPAGQAQPDSLPPGMGADQYKTLIETLSDSTKTGTLLDSLMQRGGAPRRE